MVEVEHVKEYWNDIFRYGKAKIIEQYGKRIEEKVIDMYIILLSDREVGYIQSYDVDKSDLSSYRIEDSFRGIDLCLADYSIINKGFGSKILSLFIKDYILKNIDTNYICIDPSCNNTRANRVYQKVGFKQVFTEVDSYSKLLTYYMLLSRKEFLEKNC